MREKRIGIDARIAYYAQGGIRSYVLGLLWGLAEIDPQSSYVILHSRKDPAPPQPGPNFHLIPCWTPCHHRLERWALGLEILRLRLDLLHSPDFIPPTFGARKSVITVHDLTFLHYPQFMTAESHRYYNEQIAWACRRADAILADSRATSADLVSLLDVPSEKIHVAHLAADQRFQPQDAEEACDALARYALSPGYLLFVGTLEPRKNLPGLFQAYRLLLDEGEDGDQPIPSLVVVGGKGWLYEAVFQSLERLDLVSHVRFLHNVPDDCLPALYGAASLLVLPSFYEGFGLTALEAMACGTPVIVSHRASLPEVVGPAGITVNPEDPADIAASIGRVLHDDALRKRMRQMGITRAASFSWKKLARRTRSLYQHLLAD